MADVFWGEEMVADESGRAKEKQSIMGLSM